MDNRHLIAKTPVKPQHRLKGQSNLGNQYDGFFSLLQHRRNQFHIDLGFSAAGNAVNQGRPQVSCCRARRHIVHDGLLSRVEGEGMGLYL